MTQANTIDQPDTELISKAIEMFRELDQYHEEDALRLDMNEWGTSGITEYVGLIDDRDNFAHYQDFGYEPEDMDNYDRERRGFVDEDNPDRLVAFNSEEGQELFHEYIRFVTEEEAKEQFDQKYNERFLSPFTSDSCGTAGCAAYWLHIWFSPEDVLDRIRNSASEIEREAIKLLGVSPAVASNLMVPEDQRVYEHARPAHVALVLQKYLDTGIMSWEGVVDVCEDSLCAYCDDGEEDE